MVNDTFIIAGSAASIGFVHTILGPDHYLPLVAMAKTNGWSAPKTASYVAVCGISHVFGTLLVGSLVFLLGLAFFNLETVQSLRANFAGWFLLIFGAIYFIWGMNWAIRERRIVKGGKKYDDQRISPIDKPRTPNIARCTPFALFLFFILGPCEPLIPLMSLGSESTEFYSSLLVVTAFCGTTILTMLICVMFFYYGFSRFSFFLKFENYMHAATGLILFLCGSSIQFFGL